MNSDAFRSICLALLTLIASIAGTQAHAQTRCERIEPIAPVKGAHRDDSLPEIRWPGNPQATYRVQIAIVLPEGRLLDSVDTQVVGNRWVFGAPISVPLAAIKVLVSRACEHYTVQDLHAAPPYFFYDALGKCAIEPTSMVQIQNTLHWKASAKAEKYAITLFEALSEQGALGEMRRLDRFETTEPLWEIPKAWRSSRNKPTATPSATATMIASIQAQCGVVWSLPRAMALTH